MKLKRPARHQAPSPAVHIEGLERRSMMSATIPVTTTADAGAGSLRAAVLAAASGDAIDLSHVSGTISLASEITIDKSLTLTGPGASGLTISGNNHATRAFHLTAGLNVGLSGLTIDGAGTPGAPGGAIYAEGVDVQTAGTLTLANVVLSDNLATEQGGAVAAVYNDVVMIGSRVTGNAVTQIGGLGVRGLGGGVSVVHGGLTVTGSTFDGNGVTSTDSGGGFMFGGPSAYGGAIAVLSEGGNQSRHGLVMTNSTVYDNTVQTTGAHPGQAQGAAAWVILDTTTVPSDSEIVITNSTVAGNKILSTGGGDSAAGMLLVTYTTAENFRLTNNIFYGNTGAAQYADLLAYPVGGWTAVNNLVGLGTDVSPYATLSGADGNVSGVDPLLGTLGDNGGATPTLPLLAGSPAINAGTATGTPATDQRGGARVGATDIGAFEFGAAVGPDPVSLDGGVLTVNGTGGADTIAVWRLKSRPNVLRVVRNGHATDFDAADVSAVRVYGLDGADAITVSAGTADAFVAGGHGNDTLRGSDAGETLSGGAGDDVLYGRGGRDRLNGQVGDDHLYGGAADDRLHGGGGDDMLDGGDGRDGMWGDAGDDAFMARNADRDFLFGDVTIRGGIGGGGGDTARTDRRDSIEGKIDLLA